MKKYDYQKNLCRGGRERPQLGRGRKAGEDPKTRYLNLNTLKTVQYCVWHSPITTSHFHFR